MTRRGNAYRSKLQMKAFAGHQRPWPRRHRSFRYSIHEPIIMLGIMMEQAQPANGSFIG